MSMNKKVPTITERNAEDIFKFYTLNQREIDTVLKNDIYQDEKSQVQIAETDRVLTRQNMKKAEEQSSFRQQSMKRGEKVLARLANAVEASKPSEFEYWDFGRGETKQRLTKSVKYKGKHFEGVVKSLKICHDKSVNKKSHIFLTTTFHENFAKKKSEASIHVEKERSLNVTKLQREFKRRLDISTNSDRQERSFGIESNPSKALRQTYGHLLTYGVGSKKRSQVEELQRVFKLDQPQDTNKSEKLSTQQSRVVDKNKFTLPQINCSQLTVGRKASDIHDTQESSLPVTISLSYRHQAAKSNSKSKLNQLSSKVRTKLELSQFEKWSTIN